MSGAKDVIVTNKISSQIHQYSEEGKSIDNILFVCVNKSNKNISLDVDLKKSLVARKIFGVIIGRDNEEYSVKVNVLHSSSNTFCRVFIKSLLFDNSSLHVEGKIKVEKEATGTDSFFKHDTILIGENSFVNTQPKLEIECKDVKCSHGASISYVNEQMMFYLNSRGVNQIDAIKIITDGFIFSELPDIFKRKVSSLIC